jgi:hypothetical protein
LLGSSFSTGRIINSGNVRERPGYFLAVLETESELVIPIKSEAIIVGLMNSESEERNHYDSQTVIEVGQLASALGGLLLEYGWSLSTSSEEAPWIQRLPTCATRTPNNSFNPTPRRFSFHVVSPDVK